MHSLLAHGEKSTSQNYIFFVHTIKYLKLAKCACMFLMYGTNIIYLPAFIILQSIFTYALYTTSYILTKSYCNGEIAAICCMHRCGVTPAPFELSALFSLVIPALSSNLLS